MSSTKWSVIKRRKGAEPWKFGTVVKEKGDDDSYMIIGTARESGYAYDVIWLDGDYGVYPATNRWLEKVDVLAEPES